MLGDSLNASTTRSAFPKALTALLTLVFLAVLIRTAWIGDDAMISLRTVLNVTHGFGLTYNIGERVQTFTHPLWLGLLTLAYSVSGTVLLSTLALSVVVSVTVFWITLTRAASQAQTWLVAIILLSSRAFVDYSTSGLENPLAHLLLAALVLVALRHRDDLSRALLSSSVIASLLYLTRPDLVLLALPVIVLAIRRSASLMRAVGIWVVGTLPAVAWTLFSLLYYGFPFPNTAYAKLGTGISRSALWQQGLLYLVDATERDPLTMVVIGFAVIVGLAARQALARAVASGILLYLAYVTSIGGDFMAGRFLSAPALASALVVGWLLRRPSTFWLTAIAVLGAVGLTSAHVPILSNAKFDDSDVRPTGIVDERGVFFQNQSLVRASRRSLRSPGWPTRTNAAIHPRVTKLCGLVGATGLDQGPYWHVLDECALTDPLLARLPSVFNDEWRIGHFRRAVPEGYEESLAKGENLLADPQLHAFYDQIRLITRSPRLLSADRLRAIVRMNTGRFDHLVDVPFYRHSGSITTLDTLRRTKPDGTAHDAPDVQRIGDALAIACQDTPGRRYLDVSLDADDAYRLTFVKRNVVEGALDLGPVPEHRRKPGLVTYLADIPPDAVERGFDTIVVEPTSGDDIHAIGHLLIEGTLATDAEVYQRRLAAGEHVEPR